VRRVVYTRRKQEQGGKGKNAEKILPIKDRA
jgi:hypothetical protein